LVEVELPLLGEGEVLVSTLYSGISAGTELLAYRGEVDKDLPLDEKLGALAGTFEFPFRYGYSCVGRVEESRADVGVGSLVFCFHPHQARLVVPATETVTVEGVDPRAATMFPLVETGLQISLDAGDVAHEQVVVMGLGPVGILTGGLLARAGASVIGVDPRGWRRRAAESFGFEAVGPVEIAEVALRTNGAGAALVIEASGNGSALERALEILDHEGTVLVASWYGNKPVSLPLGAQFHRRRLTIKSTQVSTIPSALAARWSLSRRRAVARALLEELPLKQLATHDFDLHDAPVAFAAVDDPPEGLIHAALRYEQR
jgi:2-desacetyl-2-hydroxyethyl bacteriochlorophyllide A dehydrogenase